MAVDLSFRVCFSCNNESLTFYETTGQYSGTNLGGWGAPNPETTDAETAVLEITDGEGTVTTIDLFTEGFPTSNKDAGFEITPDMLGLTSTTFSDGIYTFKYTVTRTSATAFSDYESNNILFSGNAKCCVDSLFADIDDFSCACNATKLELALKADALYKGLQYAAKCGQEETFTDILETISDLCDETGNCSNCN